MKLLAAALTGAWLAVGTAHAGPPLIRAEAEPATVGVGDTFSYVVEARLDARGLDTSSVRIFADTGPFAQVGPTTTRRSTLGSDVVVRLEQRLGCLDLACAPDQGVRRIHLPAARVSARVAGGGVTTGRAAAVAVGVEPRVSTAAVSAAAPPYRQQTELPAPTSDAGRLAELLTIAAATLGFVAVLLAGHRPAAAWEGPGARGGARTGAPASPRVGQAAGSGPQARGGPRLARRRRGRSAVARRAMPRASRGPRPPRTPRAPSGSPSASRNGRFDHRARSPSQTSVG